MVDWAGWRPGKQSIFTKSLRFLTQVCESIASAGRQAPMTRILVVARSGNRRLVSKGPRWATVSMAGTGVPAKGGWTSLLRFSSFQFRWLLT
ncbi:hypothetical protein HYQ46_007430 [Verticillium longisporum]|nr:hypothetical protein HYQ46_007430 [Verticillium longisporum]